MKKKRSVNLQIRIDPETDALLFALSNQLHMTKSSVAILLLYSHLDLESFCNKENIDVEGTKDIVRQKEEGVIFI